MEIVKKVVTIFSLYFLCSYTHVYAEGFYKCIDENGETTYQSIQCPEISSEHKVQVQKPPPLSPKNNKKLDIALDEIHSAIEATRNLRAVKSGMSRATLDKMEGYSVEDEQREDKRIKIKDWVKRESASGNYYIIEGIIKNISNSAVSHVKIKVKALDENAELVLLEEGLADPASLQARQEGTFSIYVKRLENINSFRLSVLYKEQEEN